MLKPPIPITREDRHKTFKHIHPPNHNNSTNQTQANQQQTSNLLPQSRISMGETSSHIPLNHHGGQNQQRTSYQKIQERIADKRFFKCWDLETNGRLTKGNKVKYVGLGIPGNTETRPMIQNTTAIVPRSINSTNRTTITTKKPAVNPKMSTMYKKIQHLINQKPIYQLDKPKNTTPTITNTTNTQQNSALTLTTQFETIETNESIIKMATIKRPTNTNSKSSITITRRIKIGSPGKTKTTSAAATQIEPINVSPEPSTPILLIAISPEPMTPEITEFHETTSLESIVAISPEPTTPDIVLSTPYEQF